MKAMILNMLEAISEILKDSKESEVRCAKIMLNQIINGMKDEKMSSVCLPIISRTPLSSTGSQVPQQYATISDATKTPETKRPQENTSKPKHLVEPSIEVDDKSNKITRVLNATKDTKIILDNVTYTPQQVIGMTFKTGRIE